MIKLFLQNVQFIIEIWEGPNAFWTGLCVLLQRSSIKIDQDI